VVDGQAGPLTRFALDVALKRKKPVPVSSLPVPGIASRPANASKAGWNALQIAKRELAAGAGEAGGDNKGPDVMRYHAVTGGKAGESWCASFVSYCFKEGNPGAMPYAPNKGARATLKAFKDKGWAYQADLDNPPEPGDIVVWWRNKLESWEGHIGIVSGYSDGIVHTIEGNRGDYPSKVSAFHYKLGKIDRLLGFARAKP
jgi:CHAP domain